MLPGKDLKVKIMTRRAVLRCNQPTQTMLAIAALVSSAAAFGPKGNNKKNVLYFIADDLRPEFAAPYWQKQVGGAATPQTPSGFSPTSSAQ